MRRFTCPQSDQKAAHATLRTVPSRLAPTRTNKVLTSLACTVLRGERAVSAVTPGHEGPRGMWSDV